MSFYGKRRLFRFSYGLITRLSPQHTELFAMSDDNGIFESKLGK